MAARVVVMAGESAAGMRAREYDAVIVGSGPNGLAAAIALARAGSSVLVLEAADVPGGGTRSQALTLPGFIHDVCSAVHPLGAASPFFRRLPLAAHGLEWVQTPAAVAHPFDDGTAMLLERSTGETAEQLGPDSAAYRALMEPLVVWWEHLYPEVLGPVLHLPRHPLLLARFGLRALPPAAWLARRLFKGARARALFTGIAAQATLGLRRPPSAAFGLILGVAGHAVGWPVPRGGSRSIAAALVSCLRSLGSEVVMGVPVRSLDDLPRSRVILLNMAARQLLRLAGTRLPFWYRKQLEWFRYGLGTFKLDWALHGPIPWRVPQCARAATVHLGGTLDEMEEARQVEWQGRPAERPFVILAQPTLFDPSRAPEGKHVAWAHCHLPNGGTADMIARIEAQIERFAPGFCARTIARHAMGPAELQRKNPNLIGGDINGGEATLWQQAFRPAVRLAPYTTPLRNVFLCSSSTPPGGSAHGMCGYHAARAALRWCL
jgi:phytoene dehydrogenase-like protein